MLTAQAVHTVEVCYDDAVSVQRHLKHGKQHAEQTVSIRPRR